MFKRFTDYDTHAKQVATIRSKYTAEQLRLESIICSIREGFVEYLKGHAKTKIEGIQSAFSYNVTPIVSQFDLSNGIYPVLLNMAKAIQKEYPINPLKQILYNKLTNNSI